ncbi:40S ribosomal protein S11 [Penicillium atrosanguineum]|uniref:40S ribosomal protein S11 n=1 Tax=Penicillium atrosanguineum TaxID=1132637 RepID=UPI002391F7D1|nr:40S ribosomal protein S11 [Penicillium atrosanguineum]KAJ5289841.1 40S ribosomal protein S11 [Penicillium atrosanguineum]
MSSPPTSKRIKTSASTGAPSHLLAQQQQINPFQRVPTFDGIPMPTAPIPQQQQTQQTSSTSRKRPSSPTAGTSTMMAPPMPTPGAIEGDPTMMPPAVEATPKKKGRTNTPWTAEEEQRLKTMRDAGRSWSEIAKTFPTRTEGSVKKHWYKDMHYAEFGEEESMKLRDAIKEYEANKWKVIGQKVGKPAKACEQYAKEHFKNL